MKKELLNLEDELKMQNEENNLEGWESIGNHRLQSFHSLLHINVPSSEIFTQIKDVDGNKMSSHQLLKEIGTVLETCPTLNDITIKGYEDLLKNENPQIATLTCLRNIEFFMNLSLP